MIICQNCGNQMSDDIKFCLSCGTSIAATASMPQQSFGQTDGQQTVTPSVSQPPVAPPQVQAQPYAQTHAQQPYTQPNTQTQAQQPYAQTQTQVQTEYKEAPISTGGYFGILFLLAIPLINFLFLIIWACGGCAKVNKRNLSRAILLWMLISTVLSVLFILAGGLLFAEYFDTLKELINQTVESGINY